MIDLAGGWRRLWTALDLPSDLQALMGVVGVILVVTALFTWLWKRRRGGSQGIQDMNGVWWTLGIGGVLLSPNFLIPILLGLSDGIINAGIGVLQIGTGG